ncbi:unnamed protein product [Prunus brigantina]
MDLCSMVRKYTEMSMTGNLCAHRAGKCISHRLTMGSIHAMATVDAVMADMFS